MRLTVLLTGTALLIVACDKPDPHICGSLPMMFPGTPVRADDYMQATTYCVERWAARLSHASDTASEVASAVVANCDGIIVAYESAKAKEKPGSEMKPDQAREYWRKRALFIAVQTRAGHCYPKA